MALALCARRVRSAILCRAAQTLRAYSSSIFDDYDVVGE